MASDVSERVLAAAREVFAEQGLGATLADVAARAGVGVASVYRRFTNKDELILELFAGEFARWERLAAEAADAADPWDGFVRYFEESTEALARDRGFRQLVLGSYSANVGWARGSAPDKLIELFASTEAAMRKHHTRLVRRAQSAGALRTDVEPIDMLMLTISVHATLNLHAAARRPDIYQRVLGIILDGLRPARTDVTPLPVGPLTDADLYTVPP